MPAHDHNHQNIEHRYIASYAKLAIYLNTVNNLSELGHNRKQLQNKHKSFVPNGGHHYIFNL